MRLAQPAGGGPVVAPTTRRVGSSSCRGSGGSAPSAATRRSAAHLPFARWGWWTLVSSSAAGAVPSKPTIERSPGTAEPALVRRQLGAERERVAEREHRGAPGPLEQGVRARPPRLGARQRALLDVQAGCVEPGAGERAPAAVEAPPRHAVDRAQREAEEPDPAVAELEQVAHRGLGSRAVVDADEVHAGEHRRIDDDRRQAARQRRDHQRIVRPEPVHDEPVDGRVADRRALRLAVGEAGDEHDREPLLVGPGREPLQEQHGRGVVEGAREAVVEHHADRGGDARAQAARDRVGPGVAQLRRGAQHALAQRGRQLIRPVVGVRHGARRDAQRTRDRHEPGLPRRWLGPRWIHAA